MRKVVKLVHVAQAMLMLSGVLAVIGGLGYAVWRSCFLFAACGTELKVIIVMVAGIVITGVILFSINLRYQRRLSVSSELYRRKADAYARMLPLIAKMIHAGRNRPLLLSDREKEQLSLILLELGLLVDEAQVDILGDFRQDICRGDIPLHEMLFILEDLLRQIRQDLGHKNTDYREFYSMSRLWIDHCDEVIEIIEDLRDEKNNRPADTGLKLK
ncbi:MAG: hypothetical protein WCI51_13700 [Lentisphaerota bacterium]